MENVLVTYIRIGDEITVRVINVNKDERSIDFEIVGMKGTRRREPNEGTRVFKTGGSSERKPRSSKSGSTGTSKGKSSGKSRRGEASGSSKSASKKSRNKKFFENAPKAKRKKKR